MSLVITPTHPQAVSYVSLAEATAYLQNRTDATEWNALTDDQKEQLLKMATRQIDSFRFHGTKMYKEPRDYRNKQKLEFPRYQDRKFTVNINSVTINTIVSSALANQAMYPDDYFNGGAIVVMNGNGKGQTLLISDFVMATGQITLGENFTTTPAEGDQILIIAPVEDDIKFATIEQAYFLTKGGSVRAQMQADGVVSYSIGDLSETFSDKVVGNNAVKLSSEAENLLSGYISTIGEFC